MKILNNLKQSKKVQKAPKPNYDHEYDYNDEPEYDPNAPPGPTSGKPGIDYPALSEIPETSFSCKEQRYKGFFGDPETNCQVWHYCDLNGGKASFLCPNGTIFSQVSKMIFFNKKFNLNILFYRFI